MTGNFIHGRVSIFVLALRDLLTFPRYLRNDLIMSWQKYDSAFILY